jgi:hypothetical protein
MQPEYFTAIACAATDAPGLEQPDGEQPEIAKLAEFDEALGDPPPHAVNPSPKATTTAISAADRHPRRPLLNVRVEFHCALGRRSSTPTSIHRSSTCCQSIYTAQLAGRSRALVRDVQRIAPVHEQFAASAAKGGRSPEAW